MADTVITVVGLEPLIKRLGAAKQPQVIRAAMKAAGAHVKSVLSKYPPASEANDPNARRWYKRGTGSFWRVRSGEIHSRATSETLGRRWTVRAGVYDVTIGNSASYAPYVHDAEKQTWFHAARGWKNTADVAESETGRVVDMVRNELMRVLQG